MSTNFDVTYLFQINCYKKEENKKPLPCNQSNNCSDTSQNCTSSTNGTDCQVRLMLCLDVTLLIIEDFN